MKGDIEIGRRKPLNLLDLSGEVDFAPDFDHKALRTLRAPTGAPAVHPLDASRRGGGRPHNPAGLCEDDAE